MSAYLVKLVRDRVAENLDDPRVEYAPIDDRDEAIKRLRAKLVEEAIEYLQDPSVHELADVQEIVEALAKLDPALGDGQPLGGMMGRLAVSRAQRAKREERGGFDGLTGMWAFPAGRWENPGAYEREVST